VSCDQQITHRFAIDEAREMAGNNMSAGKEKTLINSRENSSDRVLSKEAIAGNASLAGVNPQYPSGITLYLIMTALMLSMFLVGFNNISEVLIHLLTSD
jgi:hypothetical protein